MRVRESPLSMYIFPSRCIETIFSNTMTTIWTYPQCGSMHFFIFLFDSFRANHGSNGVMRKQIHQIIQWKSFTTSFSSPLLRCFSRQVSSLQMQNRKRSPGSERIAGSTTLFHNKINPFRGDSLDTYSSQVWRL